MNALHRWTLAVACTLLALVEPIAGQGATRRLTTIDGLRQFPGYYHLQNVMIRGEFAEDGTRIVLRSESGEIRVQLADEVKATNGPVEVRGQLIDIGRLEVGDPRAGSSAEGRDKDRWPRPGEEIFLRVTGVTEAPAAVTATVRALALEPWKFQGRVVTVTGNFRGKNLYGDQPGAPGPGRYDFVLRTTEGAIWVTGQQPKGRGFDLDVTRRVDTDRWLEVTGNVVHQRGLVSIEATRLILAKAPATVDTAEEAAEPPPPPPPVDVVFSSPSKDETDVSPTGTVRIQFSRGLNPKLVNGGVRITYLGAPAAEGETPTGLPHSVTYDAASRAIEIKFAQPLERFRTVKVETLDTLKGFDGGAVPAWTITFSVGN